MARRWCRVKPLLGLQYLFLQNNGQKPAVTKPTIGDSQKTPMGFSRRPVVLLPDYYGLFFQRAQRDTYTTISAMTVPSDAVRGGRQSLPIHAHGTVRIYWGSLGFAIGADIVRFTFDYSLPRPRARQRISATPVCSSSVRNSSDL
jgi:hypothetical protein